jgi:hypothetical protein
MMKTYTPPRFSEKQRIILEMLAAEPIESEMDYNAARAYFIAISLAKTQQTNELGGFWDLMDMQLMLAVGKRLALYRGVPEAVRGGISAALYQVGEIHPALATVKSEFLE